MGHIYRLKRDQKLPCVGAWDAWRLLCKQEVAGSIPAGSIPTTAGKSGDMDIVVVSAAADHRSSAGRDVSVHGADPRRRAGDPHLFWTMCRAV